MRTLIQQVHIYLSLLSFSSLCVFGIIGVHATMAPKWEDRPQSPAKRWEVPFAAPKDLDDEALAEKIRREIAPPLANPIAKQFLRHTPEGKLQLDFYQVNGLTRVIVDLVATGSTLKANGLVETEVIAKVTSRLIVNRTALKTRPEAIGAMIARFRDALASLA